MIKQNRGKRFLSAVMTLVVLFSTMTALTPDVYADAAVGSTNPANPGGSGSMGSSGYLVTIHSGDSGGTVREGVIKYYEGQYDFLDTAHVSQGVLVRGTGGNGSSNSVIVTSAGGAGISPARYVDPAPASSLAPLSSRQRLIDAYNDQSLNWSTYKSIVGSVSSSQFEGVIKPKADGSTATIINNFIADPSVPDAIAFLEILTYANAMSGNRWNDDVRKYVEGGMNQPEASSYVYLQLHVIGAEYNARDGRLWWYSPASWFATYYPGSIESYGVGKSGNVDYKANKGAHQRSLYEAFASRVSGNVSDAAYTNSWLWSETNLKPNGAGGFSVIYDASGHDYRYMAMTVDGPDNPVTAGTSGYTFFANGLWSNGNSPPANNAKIGQIHLKALPKNKVVPKDSVESADLSVSLYCDSVSAQTQFKEKFAKAKSCQITFTWDAGTKQGISQGGGSVVGPWSNGKTITVSSMSELEALISKPGGEVAHTDPNNRISSSPASRTYKVRATVKFPGDATTYNMAPRGVVKDNPPWAEDTASWVVENPDIIKYYSSPRTPYVEIKNGSPYSGETYEAMAGIPTTESCYIGFGATEFMLNMELKYVKETGTREYKLTYAANQCWYNNVNCSGPAGGSQWHTEPVPATEDSPAIPGVPHTAAGPCGVASCCDPKTENQYHPQNHTYIFTVTQQVEQYSYMDIEKLDLWQVTALTYNLNPELFMNPSGAIDPNTGFAAFYSVGSYNAAARNGRLRFDYKLGPDSHSGYYGNTVDSTGSGTINTNAFHGKDKAAEWANGAFPTGTMVSVKAISDYIDLATTEGHQTGMYYVYESQKANAKKTDFTKDKFTSEADPIKWSKVPTKEELWDNNGNSAARWKPDHITRSGYNGNFSAPANKWNNSNSVNKGTSPVQERITDQQPNKMEGGSWPGSFNNNGFDNDRMLQTGLKIWDYMSTDGKKTWPVNGGYVWNGHWETSGTGTRPGGWKQTPIKISYPNAGGRNTAGPYFEEWEEVGYSKSHSVVNDILIHNPVSAEFTAVYSNDSKYDMRTTASLNKGKDPVIPPEGCPNNDRCQFSTLKCTIGATQHTAACYSMVNSGYTIHYGGNNAHTHASNCNTYEVTWTNTNTLYCWHRSGCSYGSSWHVCGSNSHCDSCADGHQWGVQTSVWVPCNGVLNTHACTAACYSPQTQVLSCTNPHHYLPGETRSAASMHYPFGDSRCYKPCGNNANHNAPATVSAPGGKTLNNQDVFINLDREFQIYYPNIGNFAQQPDLWGISETTSTRGKGYTNNMDTDKWTRNKWVIFPVNVLDANGELRLAQEPIDCVPLPHNGYVYTFYAVLGTYEAANVDVEFNPVASNARQVPYYSENERVTNRDRDEGKLKAAKHTAYKAIPIDVLGYIGNLTLHDTGDFRFAELFKNVDDKNPGWLVQNLVRKVNYNLSNNIFSDRVDIRQEVANASTNWHSTYGHTTTPTGGKSRPYLTLPLTPAKNNIPELREEPMRPGYQLYLDIETVGNYYGENYIAGTNQAADTNLFYKLQVTPKYWALNTKTGVYTPVDVYMGIKGEYTPVVLFSDTDNEDGPSDNREWIYYLNWLEESGRRNYTSSENTATINVQEKFSINSTTGGPTGGQTAYTINKRVPTTVPDPIGIAYRLWLNDLNRTFIGSSIHSYARFGTKANTLDKNPQTVLAGNQRRLDESLYQRQSQRWHWTLGLPSSSVFVFQGEPYKNPGETFEMAIKKITDGPYVIVCAVDILVQGEVWTLRYDALAVNNLDGGKMKVFPPGTPDATPDGTYTPPPKLDFGDGDGAIPLAPLVIYEKEKTSYDDLSTQGTH